MKKVFIITGTARSGSTLLNLMLGNDKKGLAIGELVALMRPWEEHHLLNGRSCFCKKKDCNFWQDIRNAGEKNVYPKIFDKYTNVEFIVDSSKHVFWLTDQIKYSKGRNYEVIPIISYKTPLEYAYSLYKRNKLKGWKRSWISKHQTLFKYLKDFSSVKYADLAKDPAGTLRNLSDKLGIPFFSGKEKFWKNDHSHFLFGSNTVKKSRNLIYYEDQYDDKKLKRLEQRLTINGDGTLTDILKVLDAFDVSSGKEVPNTIYSLKNSIAQSSFLTRLKYRARGTKYFMINKMVMQIGKKL